MRSSSSPTPPASIRLLSGRAYIHWARSVTTPRSRRSPKGSAHITDTFDGSLSDQTRPLSCLQLANSEKNAFGATESSSIELILELDSLFPANVPLLVPPGQQKKIELLCQSYQEATQILNARQPTRAGWLFCNEEGYWFDALHREAFEAFLTTAEELLSDDGPFFWRFYKHHGCRRDLGPAVGTVCGSVAVSMRWSESQGIPPVGQA